MKKYNIITVLSVLAIVLNANYYSYANKESSAQYKTWRVDTVKTLLSENERDNIYQEVRFKEYSALPEHENN